MKADNSRLDELIQKALAEPGPIVVLTGAGLSAESGIPTFRGHDGYWTIGSRNYRPAELATYSQFTRTPGPVWAWYLSRRATYAHAQPNSGHYAIVEMEELLGDRFVLVTQNVDGLHQKAGSSEARTYAIHGDIHKMRCVATCTNEIFPLPDLTRFTSDLSPEETAYLTCQRCGGWMRPHVLWFDEMYNEEWYRFHSAYSAASRASLLLVVGTSGATNLPAQMGQLVVHNGACLIDINPDKDYFASLVAKTPFGLHLQTSAGESLPLMVSAIRRTLHSPR